MTHMLSTGLKCDMTTTAEIVGEYDIRLVEVSCIHGFRWMEGPSVEERTWHPALDPKKGPCGVCGEPLPSSRARYCSERCARIAYRSPKPARPCVVCRATIPRTRGTLAQTCSEPCRVQHRRDLLRVSNARRA